MRLRHRIFARGIFLARCANSAAIISSSQASARVLVLLSRRRLHISSLSDREAKPRNTIYIFVVGSS
ncbi:unnamed protein product [Urochloa humidicola]